LVEGSKAARYRMRDLYPVTDEEEEEEDSDEDESEEDEVEKFEDSEAEDEDEDQEEEEEELEDEDSASVLVELRSMESTFEPELQLVLSSESQQIPQGSGQVQQPIITSQTQLKSPLQPASSQVITLY